MSNHSAKFNEVESRLSDDLWTQRCGHKQIILSNFKAMRECHSSLRRPVTYNLHAKWERDFIFLLQENIADKIIFSSRRIHALTIFSNIFVKKNTCINNVEQYFLAGEYMY